MKKNRGFVRKLKRDNISLQQENEKLKLLLSHVIKQKTVAEQRYNSIRGRVVRMDVQKIISDSELRCVPLKQDELMKYVKQLMLQELISNGTLTNCIKDEIDTSFVGMGTRYNLSLECLLPQ